jgi:hypothetical protein
MEIRIMPELLESIRPLIMVIHDESCSCFQSNDGCKTGWFDEDNRQIRSKGTGKSLMVSAFLCESHGLPRLSDGQKTQRPGMEYDSKEIIKPGSNEEGYRTNTDLMKQTNGESFANIQNPSSWAVTLCLCLTIQLIITPLLLMLWWLQD